MQLLEAAKTLHRLTAAEYMTLDVKERTELLGGAIYDVSPRNEPHRYAVRKLTQYLSRGLDRRYIVQAQDAVAVPGWQGTDAPQIGVAVLQDRFYRPGPTAADALAFIDVSDTTYSVDRGYKIPLYLSAGVASWIVNIPLRHVEFFGSVEDLEREQGRTFTERDTLEILGVSIRVTNLFDHDPEEESA